MVLALPGHVMAWVGLELNAKGTAVDNRYGLAGTEGRGSLWEFSGRIMYQDSFGSLDAELHWLGQGAFTAGDVDLEPGPQSSPFRYLDMETVHSRRNDQVLFSEIDRLTMRWNASRLTMTAGRQAVSWGEAFFYNIGDLFGAFPITETNRRYKPGIDALTTDLPLGVFSNLSLVVVPGDDSEDSYAANCIFPLGSGTFSLTGGRILDDDKGGAGYTVDIAGTQVYSSLLVTSASDGDDYTQFVAGAERQVGPYTLILGEIYRNGWGTGDPDDYSALLLSGEFRSGNVLTLGRYSLAFSLSRQVSPLVTFTPALFANLSDSSALVRLDGSWSISDLTDLTGGLFLGLGERPDDGIPKSEYGAVPVSIYVELVHNI